MTAEASLGSEQPIFSSRGSAGWELFRTVSRTDTQPGYVWDRPKQGLRALGTVENVNRTRLAHTANGFYSGQHWCIEWHRSLLCSAEDSTQKYVRVPYLSVLG